MKCGIFVWGFWQLCVENQLVQDEKTLKKKNVKMWVVAVITVCRVDDKVDDDFTK